MALILWNVISVTGCLHIGFPFIIRRRFVLDILPVNLFNVKQGW